MTSASPCLSADAWEQFLAGRLGPAEEERAASHVERCPRCQEQLERLTASPPTAADSAGPEPCPTFLHRLKEELPTLSGTDGLHTPPLTAGKLRGASPQVPGYDVLEELGRGGMGVVYRARQVRLGRRVALKMLRAAEEEQHAARLRAEATALARLQHPNIVQVHEVGEHEGRPFLVLEYVEGGNLAQRCGKPHEPRAAAELVRILAEAIHGAHCQGITHRDLKPGNVLLTADGVPKVSDFGLAKLAPEPAADGGRLRLEALTHSGQVLGTPQYMAPEQADHRLGPVGPATDVYALGAILYELVTGRPPFDGPTALEVLSRLLNEEALPPSRLQPGLPRDLTIICLKCLHKEPQRRYVSARELAEDLRRFRDGEPIRARPVGAAERAWRWGWRRPHYAALIAISTLLLVAVSIISTVDAFRLSKANAAKDEQLRLREAADTAATRRLYESLLTQAQALRWSGRPGRRVRALAALEKAAALARQLELDASEIRRLRNEAIRVLALTDLEIEPSWPGYPDGTIGIGFDEHYRLYARIDLQGRISVRTRAGDREIRQLRSLRPTPADVRVRVRFSPGGRFLWAWYDQRAPAQPLLVWDLHARQDHETWGLPDVRGYSAFTPGEDAIIVGFPDGSIVFYEPASGRELRRLTGGPPPSCFAMSPNRELLAVGSEKTQCAQIRDARTGTLRFNLPHADYVLTLAWSPDGKLLATGCNDHKIYLWDSSTGKLRDTLAGHGWAVCQVAFSHQGDTIASASYDGTTRIWDVRVRQPIIMYDHARRIGYSADDQLAGFVIGNPGQLNLLRWTPSKEFRVINASKPLWTVSYSGDGRFLLSTGEAGPQLWDARTGTCLATAHEGDTPTCALLDNSASRLLTFKGGFLREYPILRHQGAIGTATTVSLGKPSVLFRLDKDQAGLGMAWADAQRKTLALVVMRRGVLFFDIESRSQVGRALSCAVQQIISADVSSDAHWFAVGSSERTGYWVWDKKTGKRVLRQPGGTEQFLVFSPDARWLLSGHGSGQQPANCQLWRTAGWDVVATLPCVRTSSAPRAAYTPDGSLLAITRTGSDIALVNPTTLEPIAELRGPDRVYIEGLAFNADGSQLAAATLDHAIQLWDVRALRQRLADMGLSW